jgi:DNA (cytosine-5)-methyltransferase 1
VFAGDIRDLDLDLVLDVLARNSSAGATVDIVAGGPPCQGFSTAGKKQAQDPRNDLFLEFVRVVRTLQPRIFLLENVPGFKTMHGGAAYASASRLFRELGYDVRDTILNAADFGAPQRRTRFAMVGVLPGTTPHSFDWPPPTHHDETASLDLLLEGRHAYVTVEEALDDLAFLEPGSEAHRHQSIPRFEYAADRRNGCDSLFNHLATEHRPQAVALFQRIAEGKTVASLPRNERPKKVTMARLDRTRISNAVLALPDDMIHYAHHRIPTVREMARLQTFDDDYVFVGKRTSGFMERRVDVPQYTQVGNAVPPALGRAFGRAILQCLGHEEQDLREIAIRRERHQWVRGSSAYAGYTLDPAAQDEIRLLSVNGDHIALPCDTHDERTLDLPPVRRWRQPGARARRGQWAPI